MQDPTPFRTSGIPQKIAWIAAPQDEDEREVSKDFPDLSASLIPECIQLIIFHSNALIFSSHYVLQVSTRK